MIKRFSAIAFIFIANFVLLAHVIIPHHHHKNQVCFVNTHCEDVHGHEDQNETGHDHEHGKSNDFSQCLLKQDIVLPSHQNKAAYAHFCFVDNYSNAYGIQAILGLESFFSGYFSALNRLIHPYIPPIIYRVSVACQGLRAPPVV